MNVPQSPSTISELGFRSEVPGGAHVLTAILQKVGLALDPHTCSLEHSLVTWTLYFGVSGDSGSGPV